MAQFESRSLQMVQRNTSMKHASSTNSLSKVTSIQSKDIQPNAVDVRISKVFTIDDTKTFTISESEKLHRGGAEVLPDAGGWFTLAPGCYEAVMENEVNIAADEAGWLIPRSTLNRNGIFITSGLYDSGYSGCVAGCLHVAPGPARIKRGTRVAQFLLVEAETIGMYAGDYGKGSAHDMKYGKTLGRRDSRGAAAAAASVNVPAGSRTPDGSSSHPSRHAGTPLDGTTGAKALKRPPVPKRSTSLDNTPGQEPPKDIESGRSLDEEASAANSGMIVRRIGAEDKRNGIAQESGAPDGKSFSSDIRGCATRASMATAAMIVLQVEIICIFVWVLLS